MSNAGCCFCFFLLFFFFFIFFKKEVFIAIFCSLTETLFIYLFVCLFVCLFIYLFIVKKNIYIFLNVSYDTVYRPNNYYNLTQICRRIKLHNMYYK